MEQFPFHSIGKLLIIFGAVIIVLGLVFLLIPKIPFLGKLPGDMAYRGKNVSIYFPITTCIILSIVLTIILNLIFRK